jgi:hypothetical protein
MTEISRKGALTIPSWDNFQHTQGNSCAPDSPLLRCLDRQCTRARRIPRRMCHSSSCSRDIIAPIRYSRVSRASLKDIRVRSSQHIRHHSPGAKASSIHLTCVPSIIGYSMFNHVNNRKTITTSIVGQICQGRNIPTIV